jgi:phosphomevalonate kinase
MRHELISLFAAPVPTPILMLLSGFLVILSAALFVAYKVYGMIARPLYFRRLAKDLENNKVDPDRRIEVHKNAEIAFATQSMKVGSWFLVPSILSAISGTSVFMYQLFIGFFAQC